MGKPKRFEQYRRKKPPSKDTDPDELKFPLLKVRGVRDENRDNNYLISADAYELANQEMERNLRTLIPPDRMPQFRKQVAEMYGTDKNGNPQYAEAAALIENEQLAKDAEKFPSKEYEAKFNQWISKQEDKFLRAIVLDEIRSYPHFQWVISLLVMLVKVKTLEEFIITKEALITLKSQMQGSQPYDFMSDWQLDRFVRLGGKIPESEKSRIPPPDAIPEKGYLVTDKAVLDLLTKFNKK